MNTNEIFENLIKIEPKVVSIETLFNNPETVTNTKYDPEYQRNYVWDHEKATYFIESILLGTEIPPIIYFRNGDKIEVIDGRQRYQTILKFIRDELKLKKTGLHKLDKLQIAGKYFKDLDYLRDVFWDTKLRIIEFSFHTRSSANDEIEDIVKKEIFKRYNSGITPLKPTEIDKATYLEDDLNSYIQTKLSTDQVLFREISDLFYFEKSNIQILLKEIRKLLVQHQIPIKYYANKKQNIISTYYDILSNRIDDSEIDTFFHKFIEKINVLKRIKEEYNKNSYSFNRLVSQCVFWALSIIETENRDISVAGISNKLIAELAAFFNENKIVFEINQSSFAKKLQHRYAVTAEFFSSKFEISFDNYLDTSQEFKNANKKRTDVNTAKKETSFDELRINKPEPSSITIVDICRQMERQRFLIRPPYQRTEVINKNKSSAIIESILLGIKLPPIFVYKTENGISEVLDGQQRLLSILGFLKKEYLDENNKKQTSIKNGYSLSLKNGILKNLHGKNSESLEPELLKKINNFDLWIIEINHRYNKDFEPIDLFLRLNSKPFPIKENTFEMWNSYINREIIENIKHILNENRSWFYLRKNNLRMENESIYAALIYLQYELDNNSTSSEALDIYQNGDKINFRIRLKSEITKIFEDPNNKDKVLKACREFNSVFVCKVKTIVEEKDNINNDVLNRNLEAIFNFSTVGTRTQQSFYALWHFLSKISMTSIKQNKFQIRNDLIELFKSMNQIESKDKFILLITKFWNKYNNNI